MDAPRYSPSAEANALYVLWAETAVNYLASRRPAPRAVVLQGSAARGDAWAVRAADRTLTLLSDLDLAVVLAADADAAAWAQHAAGFDAAMRLAPAAARAPGPWTVSVFAPADLPRQLPKMGTIDLSAARVLAGEASALEAVMPRDPRAITVAESLRLLAVRVHEWDAARAAGAGSQALLAHGAKLASDAGTALVSACGAYRPGGAARRAALDALWDDALAPLALAVPWLPARIRAAQDVRLREARWDEVAAALGVDTTATAVAQRAAWEPLMRACAAWLAARDAGVTAARAADTALAAGAEATACATTIAAWLAAPPRHAAWRAWIRAARRAASPGDSLAVLAEARVHRFAPAPWRVAAAQTLLASDLDAVDRARATWRRLAQD